MTTVFRMALQPPYSFSPFMPSPIHARMIPLGFSLLIIRSPLKTKLLEGKDLLFCSQHPKKAKYKISPQKNLYVI